MTRTLPASRSPLPEKYKPASTGGGQRPEGDSAMSNVLPPKEELLAEFDSGKIPRSDTWHTLITGLYFNFDSVNEIEGWYNSVQELTTFNRDLADKIQLNHDQIEIWYGQVDAWQQQVATNKLASENFANTATHQASLAYQWAANPENTPVAEGKFSSLHYARQSEEYAEASSANAYQTRQDSIDAENAKREALNSASAASISETHAADSATHAKTSETAAAASAKDSNLSKVSASASENNAASAASSALASRDSAASSASMATQQADRSENEADRSEAAAEKINREGIPIGAIMPYYGSSAPMGWLGLTRGAKISKADYPALFKHLTDQRKAPKFSERQFSDYQDNVNWVKGMTLNSTHENTFHKGKMGITGIGVTIPGGTSVIKDACYIWYPGKTCVIRIDESNAVDRNTAIWSVVAGDAATAMNEYQFPNKWNIYHSLTDIPLPNDECFLPDAANNFIKGYEPTGTRGMGTFEQDAIRNIVGNIIPLVSGAIILDGAFSNAPYSGSAGRPSFDNAHSPLSLNFNTSRSVPTGPENVPKNLNCLWIIKAYDNIIDPEQVYAKAIIDQVNSNSSDLLSVKSELDQIGYALLDFGTVNVNSRYVKPNPFGNNVSVLVLAEVQNNGKFADTGWIYSSGSNGAFGVKGSYLENEGIVVQTANVRLGDLPSTTGTANNNSLLMTAPCRVHVWRVKG